MACIEDDDEVILSYPFIIDKMAVECGKNVVSSSRLVEQRQNISRWHCEVALDEIVVEILPVVDTSV